VNLTNLANRDRKGPELEPLHSGPLRSRFACFICFTWNARNNFFVWHGPGKIRVSRETRKPCRLFHVQRRFPGGEADTNLGDLSRRSTGSRVSCGGKSEISQL